MLIAAISAVLAGTASAGEAPSSSTAIEEIVVTAQRREERLQDVPIAISVATEEQLRRDQIYSLTDMQRITPGLEISQTFGGENNGGGRVRGIGTAVNNATAAGSVAVVVDQVPQGNVAFSQVYDLAQVEVLRGPQGTLFGQTASAGVINITTAAPDPSKFAARFGVDYSDKGTLSSEFGQRVVNGAVNIPISDTSALRLATMLKEEEGVQHNITTDQDSKLREKLFRARYLVQPTDSLTVNLIGEYNKETKDGDYFFNIARPPTTTTGLAVYAACGLTIEEKAQNYCANGLGQVDIVNYGLSAIVDWAFDSFTLTSVTGYRNKDLETGLNLLTRQAGQGERNNQRTETKSHQVSEELRISSAGDSALGYVAGVFYSKFKSDTMPLDGAPFGTPFAPVGTTTCIYPLVGPCNGAAFTDALYNIEAQAVFADLTYKFTDAWTVFGGLRYTEQDTDANVGVLPAPAVYRTYAVSDDNTSGRLGLRWTLSPDAMMYLTASRGFKGSIINIPTNSATAPIVALPPELSKSYELGTKLSFLNGTLAVDANIFHTTVQDYQAQVSLFDSTSQLITALASISELKSKGVEIDVIAVLTDNLRLNAGYLFNDVKYPSGYVGDDGLSLGGQQFLSAPKNKFSLSGEYSHGLTATLDGFFSLNAVYKSDVRLAHRTTDLWVYPAHTTLGASLGVRSKDGVWTASLYGRNITGEDEPTAYLADTNGASANGGVRAWTDGSTTLRQVGLSVNFSF